MVFRCYRSMTLKPLASFTKSSESCSARNRPSSVAFPWRSVKSTTATVLRAEAAIREAKEDETVFMSWAKRGTVAIAVKTRANRMLTRLGLLLPLALWLFLFMSALQKGVEFGYLPSRILRIWTVKVFG